MRLHALLPLATLLLACAAEQAPVAAPAVAAPARSAPAWVDNEVIPDGLAAVGVGQANVMGDKAMQRTAAVADARTKLAGKIKVRVQNMFRQLNKQTTTASSGQKPVRTEVMTRVMDNVTRQLVDQELLGAGARYTWTDPEDGSLYLFLVMTRENMDKALASTAKAEIRKEVAKGETELAPAEAKVDAAVAGSAQEEKNLNDALDKLDPNAPVK